MITIVNQVVLVVAQQGKAIILGRSGFVDVLNMRILAPFLRRVQRGMTRINISSFENL